MITKYYPSEKRKSRRPIKEVIAALKHFRLTHRLKGLTLKELKEKAHR